MVVLAEPDPVDMVRAIKKAITILPTIDPQDMHKRVSNVFSEVMVMFDLLQRPNLNFFLLSDEEAL